MMCQSSRGWCVSGSGERRKMRGLVSILQDHLSVSSHRSSIKAPNWSIKMSIDRSEVDSHLTTRALNIIRDPSHPLHTFFELLPSEKHFRSQKQKNTNQQSSTDQQLPSTSCKIAELLSNRLPLQFVTISSPLIHEIQHAGLNMYTRI